MRGGGSSDVVSLVFQKGEKARLGKGSSSLSQYYTGSYTGRESRVVVTGYTLLFIFPYLNVIYYKD